MVYFPLLLSLIVHSICVAATTQEWSLGTGIWLYAKLKLTDTKCPPDRPNFDENFCRPFIQDGKVVCTKQPGPAGRRVLFLNGFNGDGFLTKATRIQVIDFDAATDQGCWSVGPNSEIIVSRCAVTDKSQKFYLKQLDQPDGTYVISTDDNSQPVAVLANGNVGYNRQGTAFCLYETKMGNQVIPPTKGPAYFPPEEINALLGVKLPGPQTPQADEMKLPGCNAKTTTVDCLISRAINDMPPDCAKDMYTRPCKLALVGAFCGDIPTLVPNWDQVVTGTTWNQVEYCFRSMQFGPCVANPAGRACSSGQFAGIVQYAKDNGGHAPGRKVRREDWKTYVDRQRLWGGDGLHPVDPQVAFWAGVLKKLINGFVDALNAFRATLFQPSQISCLAMSTKFPEGSAKGSTVKEGCKELFRPKKPIPELPIEGKAEKAGGTFVDVVSWLFAVDDAINAARAAEWVGAEAVKDLLKRFKPRPSVAADGIAGGYVIEAKEGERTVQIFKAGDDGEAMGVTSEKEYKELKKSIGENAFDNCFPCGKPPAKRLKRQPGRVPRRVCCRVVAPGPDSSIHNFEDDYMSSDISDDWMYEPDEPAGRYREHAEFGQLANPARTVDSEGLLPRMTRQFEQWFKHSQPVPVQADPVTLTWFRRIESPNNAEQRIALAREFQNQNRLTDLEMRSLAEFILDESYSPAFHMSIGKLPGVGGLVERGCSPSQETIDMLLRGFPGRLSRGDRGVYELRDLITEDPATHRPQFVMNSNLGFNSEYDLESPYRWVINSRTGRYVSPAAPSLSTFEVVHEQGIAGRFKLIGYQPVNGGENGKRLGGLPPHGIFYFDEILR